jgi:hypothetical protein
MQQTNLDTLLDCRNLPCGELAQVCEHRPRSAMFRQERRVWISCSPRRTTPCLSELEASLLASEQQNKEMANLKHDLVSGQRPVFKCI